MQRKSPLPDAVRLRVRDQASATSIRPFYCAATCSSLVPAFNLCLDTGVGLAEFWGPFTEAFSLFLFRKTVVMPAAIGGYKHGFQAFVELILSDIENESVPLQPCMREKGVVIVEPAGGDIGERAVAPSLEEHGEEFRCSAAAPEGEAAENHGIKIAVARLEGPAEGSHIAEESIDIHASSGIK